MSGLRRLSLCLFVILNGNFVYSQPAFETVEKSVAMEMVSNFAENRERFGKFACRGDVLTELVNANDKIRSTSVKFVIFEAASERVSRKAHRIDSLDGGKEPGWMEFFVKKGKVRIVTGKVEMDEEYSKQFAARDWLPKDPWSWPIISCAGLDLNMEDPLLWMRIFREDKIIAVQENGILTRAEFDVGPQARVQVYFDQRKGNMPTFCRYIIPLDKEEEFSKKSKLLTNQVETEWTKHFDGWVPVRVRNYREGLDAKGKVRSTESWDFSIDWNTRLLRDKAFSDPVFEVGKLSVVDLWDSFSKGTLPTPD